MKLIPHFIGLLLAIACVLSACTTRSDVAGPVMFDTIYVTDSERFYFSYTDTIQIVDHCELSRDLSGVKVELIGLGRVTYTDSIGAFTIDRIPQGLSWSLLYSRSDLYTRMCQVSPYKVDPDILHLHHDYSARIDSSVKVRPEKMGILRDTMILNWEGQWIPAKIKDTLHYHVLSFYFSGVDEAGIPDANSRPYLLLSRQSQFDPIDTTSYFFIAEANPPGMGLTTLQLADSGVVKGDKLYYAVTSRPRCVNAKLNPQHPTPGRRMSEIREIVIP